MQLIATIATDHVDVNIYKGGSDISVSPQAFFGLGATGDVLQYLRDLSEQIEFAIESIEELESEHDK